MLTFTYPIVVSTRSCPSTSAIVFASIPALAMFVATILRSPCVPWYASIPARPAASDIAVWTWCDRMGVPAVLRKRERVPSAFPRIVA